MTELSTTEAKQVERAVITYAHSKKYPEVCAEHGVVFNAFTAGIEYALKELLPSRCVGFAEYVRENYAAAGISLWEDEFGYSFTTIQLYQKYITEYLKQQQYV